MGAIYKIRESGDAGIESNRFKTIDSGDMFKDQSGYCNYNGFSNSLSDVVVEQCRIHNRMVDDTCKKAFIKSGFMKIDQPLTEELVFSLVKEHKIELVKYEKPREYLAKEEDVVLRSKKRDIARWIEVNGFTVSDSVEYL